MKETGIALKTSQLVVQRNDSIRHLKWKNKNIVLPTTLKEIIKENYFQLYEWYNMKGIEEYEASFGSSSNDILFQPFVDAVLNLPTPFDAELNDIIKAAFQITNGPLNLVSDKKIGRRSLYSIAYNIVYLQKSYTVEPLKNIRKRKGNKKLSFKNAAKSKLIKENADLEKVFQNKFKNIGGAVVVMETNAQYNRSIVVTPALLGLRRIDDPNSLVNLAINKKIEVKSVILNTLETTLQVKIKIKNLSKERIQFKIPKGQVFENKEYKLTTQNLAFADDDYCDFIEPGKVKTVTLESYCLNKAFGPPRNAKGNLTVYEIENKEFYNQFDVWRLIAGKTRTYSSYIQMIKNIFRPDSYGYGGLRNKIILCFVAVAVSMVSLVYFL